MTSIGLLFKVLWSPREAMFLVSKNPRPLMPLGLLCLFTFLTQNVILANVDSSQLSAASEAVMLATLLVDPIARIAIIALLYFGLFTLVGRIAGFKSFFAITSFAFVPSVFSFVAKMVLAFRDPPSSLIADVAGSIGPAMFLHRDTTSPYLFTAVNAMDLVNIWILALL